MDSVASSDQNPVAKSSNSVVSIDQNPPQTLVSSVGDPNLELPFSDKNNGNNNDGNGNGNNQETLGLNNNGFSNDEVFKPETGLNNDNGNNNGNGNGNQKTDNGLSKDENGLSNLEKDCSGREDETSSKRRRRKSRWDNDDVASEEGGKGGRKKKSRWADDAPPVPQLPDFLMNLTGSLEFDPEIQVLNSRLLEINRMLLSGLPLEDRPEGARSPSPEPIYDVKGIRINTRENRAKERLGREKQEIIQQMIKKNPAFRPPADYRPPKVHKKLYIPLKEYPGYNFIGLIIGPRGNTQKRMEKETGAKIVIRGKGSIKEGRINQKRDMKFDSAENEDLHVLVEADTQEAVDAAAGMVQKLLQPVDEVLNEHKRQQLRELAALNGTIKDEEFCRLCGEQGHRQFACPSRFSTFKSDVLCKICGDGGHPTIDCPVKGTTGKKMDDEYQNFLAELGGSMPEGLTKPSSNTLAIGPGNGNSTTEMGVNGVKQVKEIDETNLYIGYLPPTLEDDGLMRLFSPFGTIVNAKVVKDKVTGLSKGYGFVKYTNIQEANTAISSMNGQRIDGRTIAVRVAGKVPTPVAPPAPPTSSVTHTYPVPNQSVSAYTPPANGYAPAPVPVPWGPPVVQPYGSYLTPPPPPPPPGSTMYTPYGVQYPPPMAVSSGPMSSQAVSSVGETQYPPGVQSLSSVQPLYTTPSFTYAPYYGGAPQQANTTTYVSQTAMGQSQSFANVPWASSESVPPPPVATQKTTPGHDTEYEKFMAEMN